MDLSGFRDPDIARTLIDAINSTVTEPVKFMEVPGPPPLGSTYVQIASYSTLVEQDRKLLLFYNDCKHWVLFKHVPEELIREPKGG